MTVHGISRHTDWIGDYFFSSTLVLCHNIFSDHPSALPHIQLWRKMSMLDIFVFRITPVFHKILQLFWDAVVRLIEIKQTLYMRHVFIEYFLSFFEACLWPVMVCTN